MPMLLRIASVLVLLTTAVAQEPVDFERQVLPVLQERCFRCHRAVDDRGRVRKPKGELRLDGVDWIAKGGELGEVLVPGDPDESSLYARVVLPDDHDDKMPAKGKPTTPEENELLRAWIAEGAEFGSWVGEPGPGDSDELAEEIHRPAAVALLDQLADGKRPLASRVLEQAAAAGRVRIESVQPGSPLLRVEFFGREGEVDDAAVAALKPLRTHVAHLSLARTVITDRALDVVGSMPLLVRLDLRRTAVTDRGLAALSDLSELRSLNLYGTAVTDRGLEALEGLSNLEALYLFETEVTDRGVAELAVKLPEVRIHYLVQLPESREREPDARRRRGD